VDISEMVDLNIEIDSQKIEFVFDFCVVHARAKVITAQLCSKVFPSVCNTSL
jgi:hypothetical protein